MLNSTLNKDIKLIRKNILIWAKTRSEKIFKKFIEHD